MSSAAPITTLDQVWKRYNESIEYLTLLSAGETSMGSLTFAVHFVEMKTKQIKDNPAIFSEAFSEFTDAQMVVLETAHKASENGQKIIAELKQVFHATMGSSTKFPFAKQVEKLNVLVVKVDEQIELLEASLEIALHQEADLNSPEKSVIS